MMVFALASVMTTFAANSPTGNVTVEQTQQGSYIIRTDATQFTNDQNQDIAVKADILAYNAGTKTLGDLLSDAATVKGQLDKKTALTTIFDLHDVNGGNPVGGKHRVKLYIPTLTDKCSEITVLHYSMVDNKWEIIESEVDAPNKMVTVITDDLSPIAIFAKVSTGTATGDSAQTRMWTTFAIGAAAVALVLGFGFGLKKKSN